ncbi:MAG TPA: class I SAM-dependent methyltransferase [Solirubrobacteraceae bacterium]|jgi:O-methyltransferase involved in polyketide biosynthesis
MIATGDPVSPTAHYTGYVWARNGLSPPELRTIEGRVLFESLRPVNTVNSLLGRGSLEQYLLARHRAIDLLVERAVENHGIRQVIEIASGLSARGWRFSTRYDELTYVEADLPEMVARKREALDRIDGRSSRHRVVEVDALKDSGPDSLASVAGELDPGQGLVIITEGLLGYLPTDAVMAIWRRCATILSGFSSGRYISDVHLSSLQTLEVRAFRVLLSAFVRGRVHLHFRDPGEVVDALTEAGFAHAEVRPAFAVAGLAGRPGTRLAYILEASS